MRDADTRGESPRIVVEGFNVQATESSERAAIPAQPVRTQGGQQQ